MFDDVQRSMVDALLESFALTVDDAGASNEEALTAHIDAINDLAGDAGVERETVLDWAASRLE